MIIRFFSPQFAILLGLIILVEFAAAIAGYIFRNKVGAKIHRCLRFRKPCRILTLHPLFSTQISDVVQDSLTEMITKYNSSSEEFRDTVDKMQLDVG